MVCVKPPEAFPVYHRVPQLFNQHSIEGLRKSINNVIAFVNIVFLNHNESYDASHIWYKYAVHTDLFIKYISELKPCTSTLFS